MLYSVPEELQDIKLTTNGYVITAGYNETGGGSAVFNATDGAPRFRYRSMPGFGDPSRSAAGDDNYAYLGSPNGGIYRYKYDSGESESHYRGGAILGLCLKNGKLYASDYSSNKILVLDPSNLNGETASWSMTRPTRLTVDNNGRVWVIQESETSIQPNTGGPMWIGSQIIGFNSDGSQCGTITDYPGAMAVAVNQKGQLLVGGLNEDCQIWIYDINGTSPKKVDTFGEKGGIFSGIPGEFTSKAKLHWIKGIDVDAQGNVYVGCTYGTFWGNCIEKYNEAGDLQWQRRLFCATSLDCAGIDPYNPTEVYSKYHHYSLDYSKTAPGTEWSLKGFTVNRFKYPNDPRVNHLSDVGSRALGWGVRRIGGKLFVGRSSQEGYMLELYRKDSSTDGEVLVPSVHMACGSDANNQFYNPQTKTWILKPKKDGIYNQYWDIAKNGDLFTVGDKDGGNKVIQYKYGGLDSFNNPIWEAANATVSTVSEFKWVRRMAYDSDEDAMYMTGENVDENWGSFLKVKKFPKWSTGNRTSTFTKDLPYNDAQYVGTGSNYGGGNPVAFAVAGDYMFVLYGSGHVRVLSRTTGDLVGTLQQNRDGYRGSDGQVDASYGLSAFKRAGGEYVILFENAGYGCIMMYRWCPAGTCDGPDVVIPEPEGPVHIMLPKNWAHDY